MTNDFQTESKRMVNGTNLEVVMWLVEMELLMLRHVEMIEGRLVRGSGRGPRAVRAVAAVAPVAARRLLVLLRHVLQRLRRGGHLTGRGVRPSGPTLALSLLQSRMPTVQLATIEVEVLHELGVLGYLRDKVLEGIVAVVLADERGEPGERGGCVALERRRTLVQPDELIVGHLGLALGLALALHV